MQEFKLYELDDWSPVATEIVKRLRPGMIVTLSGPLGAGKTTCVQRIAQALGSTTPAKSPTFALLRTHQLRRQNGDIRRLVHIDAYRLEQEQDVVSLDLDAELNEAGTVMLIEWPENISAWLKKRSATIIKLTIEPQADGSRLVRLNNSL